MLKYSIVGGHQAPTSLLCELRDIVGDSLLIQKPIKRIKTVKTCFSTLIVANTRGYCGETIVRISLDLSIIFSTFYEAPPAQKHFAAPSRVIQTPTGAILHSRPGAVAHASTHSTDFLAFSNSDPEFESNPCSLPKPTHLNIVQTQWAHDLYHNNQGCARLC
jgi:hypothetical protein